MTKGLYIYSSAFINIWTYMYVCGIYVISVIYLLYMCYIVSVIYVIYVLCMLYLWFVCGIYVAYMWYVCVLYLFQRVIQFIQYIVLIEDLALVAVLIVIMDLLPHVGRELVERHVLLHLLILQKEQKDEVRDGE